MIPVAFSYSRPASLDEAFRILREHGDTAKILAGGQSLLPLLKLRVAHTEHLVDIGRLRELAFIREEAGGGLTIGALTTYRDVLDSQLAAQRAPLLVEAVQDIGDVQVRNRGTLGGSLAHADPASDLPAVALALDAQVVAISGRGERLISIADYFTGSFETVLQRHELLASIRFPALPAGAGTAYRILPQLASGYSIVGCAAVIARSDGKVTYARVALTGASDVAYRATAVEDALVGSDGKAKAVAAAALHATSNRMVSSDIHADRAYRARMAQVFVQRAVEAALARSA
ncbi:MAG: FAD binding domain-containing protein [Candidatus Limnocylindrales bacterium]